MDRNKMWLCYKRLCFGFSGFFLNILRLYMKLLITENKVPARQHRQVQKNQGGMNDFQSEPKMVCALCLPSRQEWLTAPSRDHWSFCVWPKKWRQEKNKHHIDSPVVQYLWCCFGELWSLLTLHAWTNCTSNLGTIFSFSTAIQLGITMIASLFKMEDEHFIDP